MHDLSLSLDDRPGTLAAVAEALARADISIEGGGAWVVDGRGTAHLLVRDGFKARACLEAAGLPAAIVREVIVQRLDQDVPGQLGRFARRMADAGVNLEVLYSDHQHQLVVVVDDPTQGRRVSEQWMQERAARESCS